VKSPLWSTRPDLLKQYEAIAITTEDVATAMRDVVQSKAYPGGSVVQVTQEGTSIVPLGPPAPPLDLEPVRRILKAERGANLGKAPKEDQKS
jgi:hypothetical protein